MPLVEKYIEYKGIDYLDLVAHKLETGATLEGLAINHSDDMLIVDISTSYANNLTFVTDHLVYKKGLLYSWNIQSENDEYTVFCRHEFNDLLNQSLVN